jgi:hypothetical protein
MAKTMIQKHVGLVGYLGVMCVSLVACGPKQVPTPTPPPPAPVSNEKVVLSDNFQRSDPRWRQVRGQWGINAGKLTQVRDDARELNAIYYYDPLIVADADITLRGVTMMADLPQFTTAADQELLRTKRQIAGAGIVFRYQDENNFYLFRTAGEDGLVLGKMVDGEWHDLANPRAADFAGVLLKMDAPYNLRVRVAGKTIQCWIADKAVANLEDPSFTTGRVGVSTFRSKATFQSIRVVER